MELFSCGSHPADWKESSDWNKEVRWTTVWRLAVLLGKWNFHCLVCTHLIHPTRHSCLPRFVTTPNIVLWYNIWNNILPHFCVVKSNIDDLKDTFLHSLKHPATALCGLWGQGQGNCHNSLCRRLNVQIEMLIFEYGELISSLVSMIL